MCHFDSIARIDTDEWEARIPLDLPHLRPDFMRALEESGYMEQPLYLEARLGTEFVGASVAYAVQVDLLTLAGPGTRSAAARIRAWWPGFLYLTVLMCGPLLNGCSDSFWVDPDLPAGDADAVIGAMAEALDRSRVGSAIAVLECTREIAERYRGPLRSRGYLQVPTFPNARLDVRWSNLEEYLDLLRKAFRRSVRKDLSALGDLRFEWLDDFSSVAEEAWNLYKNVLERAERLFADLTPELFRALAPCSQTRLLTARDGESGSLVGIELLLCGTTVLQDLYTGIDYNLNAERRVYFNLVYPVIDYAGRQGYREIQMGQTSYQFKARLGAVPEPVWMFVKHRIGPIHGLLSALSGTLFPPIDVPVFQVFRTECMTGAGLSHD